jgi:hypothetical protein
MDHALFREQELDRDLSVPVWPTLGFPSIRQPPAVPPGKSPRIKIKKRGDSYPDRGGTWGRVLLCSLNYGGLEGFSYGCDRLADSSAHRNTGTRPAIVGIKSAGTVSGPDTDATVYRNVLAGR